ncbi:class I SAM-dependent methyltransferase [Pollutibacter soli]|uniref:class I SAM-dependent methyltransferase n=1 Tax=Pollutibacter soli TaxID=3034157 RepID=UPI003013BB4A
MKKLATIIQEKIKSQGPMSFRDFMGMALYYPGLGYYTSGKERIGKAGDYFTSPTANNLLGESIAKQLVEMWEILGKEEFAVVEYGAGDGSLSSQILSWLKDNSRLYHHISYYIIEKRSSTDIKKEFIHKIIRADDVSQIPPIVGCILSNELIDNFPVHRIINQNGLHELRVSYTEDGFTEVAVPLGNDLKNHIEKFGIEIPQYSGTEICTEMAPWLNEINHILKKGFVLTIDYGDSGERLIQNCDTNGTIHCYHKHHVNRNPFANIGDQDITADVNFSTLAAMGKAVGLEYTGFTTQSEFMIALGLNSRINHDEQMDEIKVNTMLDFMVNMSRKLKVFIQHKAVNHPMISGLLFARRAVA